jgi:RNA polymerase sigma-70 factor (ECF subfamily)
VNVPPLRAPDDTGDALPAAPSAAEAETVRCAVHALRSGDREAFRTLVQLYQQRLFALVAMMTRHRAGAEEVVQDAFVNAYSHLDRYDERRPFYPWLATIAVRLAQTWLRRHARLALREGTDLDSVSDTHQPTTASGPLGELIVDETRQSLWQSVEALSPGERTVVLLYYHQDMAVNAIASELGVTAGTVKTLLFRARKRLRTALQAADDSDVEEKTP